MGKTIKVLETRRRLQKLLKLFKTVPAAAGVYLFLNILLNNISRKRKIVHVSSINF
jgi:hypothetical protein